MLKYQKADIIFNQVAEELPAYADEGMIDYSRLIPVIQECNALLGLNINEEKEAVLPVKNYKAHLPLDFVNLNFATLCHEYTVDVTPPKGFQVEWEVSKTCRDSVTCKQVATEWMVFQKCENEYRTFKNLETVSLIQSSNRVCGNDCPNLRSASPNTIKIKGRDILTSFREGELYLNYNALMEDEDGDLLVLDHDLITPYYVWACVKKIFMQLYLNGHDDVERRLNGTVTNEFNKARRQAITVNNTPEFYEIQDIFNHNRKQFYNKYYRVFDN